ncbi:unnamed protein product, partial [marine sediment metagenome]
AAFTPAICCFWVLIPGGYGFSRTVEFLAVALGTDHAFP